MSLRLDDEHIEALDRLAADLRLARPTAFRILLSRHWHKAVSDGELAKAHDAWKCAIGSFAAADFASRSHALSAAARTAGRLCAASIDGLHETAMRTEAQGIFAARGMKGENFDLIWDTAYKLGSGVPWGFADAKMPDSEDTWSASANREIVP